ncbi:MAG: GxxExxY protein [Bacteroidota bacterium]
MTQIYTEKKINELTYEIIGCAYKVHSELGPGLLESAYEACLFHELLEKGFDLERQKELPLVYKEVRLDAGYRMDIAVEKKVLIEIKSVDALAPIHTAQVLTYLKLSKLKLALLINFNTVNLQQGIHRLIM